MRCERCGRLVRSLIEGPRGRRCAACCQLEDRDAYEAHLRDSKKNQEGPKVQDGLGR